MSDKKDAAETKKILDLIQKMSEKTEKSTENNLKLLRETREEYNKMGGGIERNYLASLAKEEDFLNKRLAKMQEETNLRNHLATMSQEELGDQIKKDQIHTMSIEKLKEQATSLGLAGSELDKILISLEKKGELEADSEKHMKSFNIQMDKASRRMGELGKASVFFSFNLNKMASDFKREMKDGAMEANWNAFRDQFFSISNLAFSTSMLIIKTTKDLVMAADKAKAAFAASTGAGNSYNGVIIDAQRNTNLYSVSMGEAATATGAMMKNTSNYTQFSRSFKTELAGTAAMLSKVGVSADSSGRTFQILTEALHVGDEKAGELLSTLTLMGTDIGISAEQMSNDLNAAMGTLSVYGPRATTVFKNIAAAAKAAGVETSTLMNLAAKFDTFAGAAKGAAVLNAVLGTTLGTTQMLMMEEDQRIETLIGSIQASGRAFKDYDRFTKKAIARELEFKDVAEAEMVLGMDLGQYETYKSHMQENENNQKKFNEAVEAAIPLGTQMMSIFNEFGLLVEPILTKTLALIKEIREWLKGIPRPIKEAGMKFILFAGALGMAVKFFGPLVMASKSLLAVFTGGGAAIGIGGGGLLAAITAFSAGLVAAAKPLMIIGGAISAIYLAAKLLGGIGSSMEFNHVQEAADDMERLEASSVKATAILENITMLKAGRAANQLTGMSMEASTTNLTTSLETIFPDTVTLVLNDRTKLETYISKVAADVYKKGRYLPK